MSIPITIQSPGGEIHYCKDNNENDNDNNDNNDNNYNIDYLVINIENNYILNRYNRLVRMICICDVFTNYYFLVYNINTFNTVSENVCYITYIVMIMGMIDVIMH